MATIRKIHLYKDFWDVNEKREIFCGDIKRVTLICIMFDCMGKKPTSDNSYIEWLYNTTSKFGNFYGVLFGNDGSKILTMEPVDFSCRGTVFKYNEINFASAKDYITEVKISPETQILIDRCLKAYKKIQQEPEK